MNMYKFVLFLLVVVFMQTAARPDENAASREKMYGVTLSSVTRLDETIESLSKLPKKPTVRIVFDPWVNPEFYNDALFRINKVSFIMGEILDSYSFNNYNLKFYKERVNSYLNYFPDKIDVWEIGNEVNGQWLGSPAKVIEKVSAAFDLVEDRKQKTAVTFYYYAPGCYEDQNYEMFTWINNNVPDRMKKGLDFVFVSYYEDECNSGDQDWDSIFKELHKVFPNAKLGIGECGVRDRASSEEYMRRFYNIDSKSPYFIGGYFWWYFKRDCVPYTKPLWGVLNEIMGGEKAKQ